MDAKRSKEGKGGRWSGGEGGDGAGEKGPGKREVGRLARWEHEWRREGGV